MTEYEAVPEYTGGKNTHTQCPDCHQCCCSAVVCPLKYTEQWNIQVQLYDNLRQITENTFEQISENKAA